MHESTRRYINDPFVARDYDRCFAGNELFAYDVEVLGRWLSPPGRVVDLGCGTGRHLIPLARAGFDLLGLDLSDHMLACAREKLVAQGLHAQLLRHDLTRLPLDENPAAGLDPAELSAAAAQRARLLAQASFDHAICMFSTLGLIHTAAARLRFLRAVHRLLRPGGTLALHVHNYWSNLASLEGWAFLVANGVQALRGSAELGDKIMPRYRGIAGMYIHVFRPRELRELLAEAGFEILEWIDLNRPRNAPLRPSRLSSIRANGFLVHAGRPL